MQKYALIGKTLKHSYSKIIHSFLGDYSYELVELEENELKEFVKNKGYNGFNVTIPYKKKIIEYLDHLDESALKMGSVNTVAKINGKLVGYNTDFYGMQYMLSLAGISLKDKKVIILGTGGTSCTAMAVAKSQNAKEVIVLSRSGEINYSNYQTQGDAQVIINTTPVGMYPNVDDCPIDLGVFKNLSGVVDVIYNPNQTKLIYNAKKMGIKCCNGLSMLVAQGVYASQIWTGEKKGDAVVKNVLFNVEDKFKNVVLVGMPSCGKSVIGKILAEKLNLQFVDSDKEIERKTGLTPEKIILEQGEDSFRNIETQVIKEICSNLGKVIATGGGAVLKEENRFYLKMNGKVVYLERDLDKLSILNRPISKNVGIEELYRKRHPIYSQVCDIRVQNNSDILNAVKGVIEKL